MVTDIFRHKKGPRKILATSLATKVLELRRRIVDLQPLARAFIKLPKLTLIRPSSDGLATNLFVANSNDEAVTNPFLIIGLPFVVIPSLLETDIFVFNPSLKALSRNRH